jgi:hypothetical protein
LKKFHVNGFVGRIICSSSLNSRPGSFFIRVDDGPVCRQTVEIFRKGCFNVIRDSVATLFALSIDLPSVVLLVSSISK